MVVVLVLGPATAALAVELDELLEQSRSASYTAEQIISCSTPDGVRDGLVRIEQNGGELRLTSAVDDDVEVATGAGTWSVSREGGLVSEASVTSGSEKDEPLYTVEDGRRVQFLGRNAMSYRLVRDGELRAELVFDDATRALVQATTYAGEDVYCQRRFVTFDPEAPELEVTAMVEDPTVPSAVEDSSLPIEVAGFERLDHYVDDDGVEFAYYSDGFFSFALFETPSKVTLDDGVSIDLDSGRYEREFTAGQVSYAWETREGGVALVGDLPPDLHEEVLAAMPAPDHRGLFRRWWRSLFG